MKRLLERVSNGKTQISKQIKMLSSMPQWQDNLNTFKNGIVTCGKDQVRFMEMETSKYFQELLLQTSGKENAETATSSLQYHLWLSFQSVSRTFSLQKMQTQLGAMLYVFSSTERKRWSLLTTNSPGVTTNRIGHSAGARQRMKFGSYF